MREAKLRARNKAAVYVRWKRDWRKHGTKAWDFLRSHEGGFGLGLDYLNRRK